MDRRKFVTKSIVFGAGIALFNACQPTQSLTAKYVKDPFDIEMVREFVLHAHSDLVKVKSMVEKTPHLINSTVDWGDGDFESALGAASHVGRQEIAGYLIGQGARMDIFTMAMLGMTDPVIAILAQFPGMVNLIGPHGFTLLHHSEIGVPSPRLSSYLQEHGLKEKFIETFKK